MNKRQVRKSYKMDMAHFLRNYYGIDNDNLLSALCSLSHKDLKRVVSFYGIKLMRMNFESVSFDQLAMGSIILVNDAFNNPAPYVNPGRTLNGSQGLNTDLDQNYVNLDTDENIFDKKQKTLRKVIKLRKDDKND